MSVVMRLRLNTFVMTESNCVNEWCELAVCANCNSHAVQAGDVSFAISFRLQWI